MKLLKDKKMNILTTGIPVEMLKSVKKFCKKHKVKRSTSFNNKVTHLITYPLYETSEKRVAKRTIKYLECLAGGK